MNSIIKSAILFLFFTLVLSFFGSYLTIAFSSVSGTINTISSPYGIGLVLSSIWSFLSFALDTLFINENITYVNQVMSSSVHIGSISWALSFFRILLGASLIVFIISLVFGGKHE